MTGGAKVSAGLCKTCGMLMLEDFFGDGMHPNCEPRAAARIRERDRRLRAAQALGTAGRRAAMKSDPAATKRGLGIIRDAARENRILSADTVRDLMDAPPKVPPNARGGLWQTAEKKGWVKAVDANPSGGKSAHGKEIKTYVSLLYVSPGQVSA